MILNLKYSGFLFKVHFLSDSCVWPIHVLDSSTTLLKVSLLRGCFSRFLNCTNGTESWKASHLLLGMEKNTITTTKREEQKIRKVS